MKYLKKRNDNSFLRVLPKSNNGLSKQKKIGQMKIQNTFHKWQYELIALSFSTIFTINYKAFNLNKYDNQWFKLYDILA